MIYDITTLGGVLCRGTSVVTSRIVSTTGGGSGCCGGGDPSRSAPEYNKRYKAENSAGCCCTGLDNCSKPSKARKGSALWNWEQEHGRLIGTFTEEIAPDGRKRIVFSKTTCAETKSSKSKTCCSLSYKVTR
jgi:hypothetical protein